MDRSWLDVPFREKEEAEDCGARWDPVSKRWYAPHGMTSLLQRWEPLPDPLPGEDRGYGSGLFVDLVPDSCWFTNIRSCVSRDDWRRIRRLVVGRAERRCEACGRGKDPDGRRRLEVHERWTFDERAETQTLRRLICLCTDCHATSHYGHAQVRGNELRAFTHLRQVTGMSLRRAEKHVDDAFAVWHKRNRRVWVLDLSILTDAGVTPLPPGADQPPATSARARSSGRAELGGAGSHATALLDRGQEHGDGQLRGDEAAAPPRLRQLARAVADRLCARYPALSRATALVRLWTAPTTWRAGVAGDAVAGRALARLSRPWQVRLGYREKRWHTLRDLPAGRGVQIEHLVIGPGGVYAVTTKRHPGAAVWAGDQFITVDGQPTTYVDEARDEAARAGARLSAASGRHVTVIPVIAVEGGRVVGAGQARGVRVVGARRLAWHLRGDLRPLDADRVRELYDLALHPTTWQQEG